MEGLITVYKQVNQVIGIFARKKTLRRFRTTQNQLLKYAFRDVVDLAILSIGVSYSFFLPSTREQWEQRNFIQ